MRALSLRQASDCEQGRNPVCMCRCSGRLHGAKRGDGEAFFNGLPKGDPHAIPSKVAKAERTRRGSGKIPNGSERNAASIPIFDRRLIKEQPVVYLTAPISLYGSARYLDAVRQVKARHQKT